MSLLVKICVENCVVYCFISVIPLLHTDHIGAL